MLCGCSLFRPANKYNAWFQLRPSQEAASPFEPVRSPQDSTHTTTHALSLWVNRTSYPFLGFYPTTTEAGYVVTIVTSTWNGITEKLQQETFPGNIGTEQLPAPWNVRVLWRYQTVQPNFKWILLWSFCIKPFSNIRLLSLSVHLQSLKALTSCVLVYKLPDSLTFQRVTYILTCRCSMSTRDSSSSSRSESPPELLSVTSESKALSAEWRLAEPLKYNLSSSKGIEPLFRKRLRPSRLFDEWRPVLHEAVGVAVSDFRLLPSSRFKAVSKKPPSCCWMCRSTCFACTTWRRLCRRRSRLSSSAWRLLLMWVRSLTWTSRLSEEEPQGMGGAGVHGGEPCWLLPGRCPSEPCGWLVGVSGSASSKFACSTGLGLPLVKGESAADWSTGGSTFCPSVFWETPEECLRLRAPFKGMCPVKVAVKVSESKGRFWGWESVAAGGLSPFTATTQPELDMVASFLARPLTGAMGWPLPLVPPLMRLLSWPPDSSIACLFLRKSPLPLSRELGSILWLFSTDCLMRTPCSLIDSLVEGTGVTSG